MTKERNLFEILNKISNLILVITGVFILIMSISLLLYYNEFRKIDILEPAEITNLHNELIREGFDNEDLKVRIRDLDYIYRRAWFAGINHIEKGINLVITALVIFIVCINVSNFTSRKMPVLPDKNRNILFENFKKIRYLFASVVIILFFGVTILYYFKPAELLKIHTIADESDTISQETATIDLSDFKKNWSNFRGPFASGKSNYHTLPDTFSIVQKWKVDVDYTGFSSPVIWNDQIFITAGDENNLYILCYDISTGDLKWKYKTSTGDIRHLRDLFSEPGFASPTPSVDSERVYAIYATGLVVAVETDSGKEVWRKQLPRPQIPYGHASSLLVLGNHLIVQYDMTNNQTVYALNTDNGKEIWTYSRQSDESWASPSLIFHNNKIIVGLITCSTVENVDFFTGEPLWIRNIMSGEVASAVSFSNDILLLASEFAFAAGLNIKTGETIWKNYDVYLPDVSSPVALDNLFIITTSGGDIVCLDNRNGELLWEHLSNAGFYSSPIITANNILIISDMSGNILFIKPNPDNFILIYEYSINERIVTIPAIYKNSLIIRSDKYLYRLELNDGCC